MYSSVHSVHNNVWVKFACLCRVLTNAKTKCHFRLHQADRLITSRRALVRSHRRYIHFHVPTCIHVNTKSEIGLSKRMVLPEMAVGSLV